MDLNEIMGSCVDMICEISTNIKNWKPANIINTTKNSQ